MADLFPNDANEEGYFEDMAHLWVLTRTLHLGKTFDTSCLCLFQLFIAVKIFLLIGRHSTSDWLSCWRRSVKADFACNLHLQEALIFSQSKWQWIQDYIVVSVHTVHAFHRIRTNFNIFLLWLWFHVLLSVSISMWWLEICPCMYFIYWSICYHQNENIEISLYPLFLTVRN